MRTLRLGFWVGFLALFVVVFASNVKAETASEGSETPAEQEETPAEQEETPTEQEETPTEQEETPEEQEETPAEQIENPVDQTEIPEQGQVTSTEEGADQPQTEQSETQAEETPESDERTASRARFRLDVGFGHWYPSEFRTGEHIKTFTVGIGVRLGLRFLEFRARYLHSYVRAHSGHRFYDILHDQRVGFTTAGLALSKTFFVRRSSVNLFVYYGVIVCEISDVDVAVGGSFSIGIEYLFEIRPNIRLGVFMEARGWTYRLDWPDGTHSEMLNDADMDLGLALVFF